MTDIFSLKVEEIVSKIKDAQLTSVEVCQKYVERISKFEKEVKAWVHFDKKLLLEKAKEADEYRRSGKPTGPLHGIPIALKDIIGTIDMPTECGTPIRKGKSYSQNAEIVDLLLSANNVSGNHNAIPGNMYIKNIAKITMPKNGIMPANICINSTLFF